MFMFERSGEPLISHHLFIRRVILYGTFSVVIIGASLGVGILGYHLTEGLSWIDSLLNASMLLGGMGPVDPLHTVAGKLFASFYALFSGVVFLVAVGVLIAPLFHRFMHSFHLAPEDVSEAEAEDMQDKLQGRRPQ
jgi:hypothetical protein